jgi:pilus assembly protein CpaF
MREFELILPYLLSIEAPINDEEVTEIMCNCDGQIWVERHGTVVHLAGVEIPERSRQAAVRNIARVLGDDISEERPLLDAHLPDGSRVAAVLAPVSVGGTIFSIRKFRKQVFTAEELMERAMFTPAQLEGMKSAILTRETVMISGGTGTGKTTLLSALASYMPEGDRVVLIEDTAELALQARNLVRLEARREQLDAPAVTIRELLRQTLRLRPDRIILGEVRGAEAFDLLQALNTGHTGTLSTIHANSARLALRRLRTCVAMAGVEIPDKAVARDVADVIQVMVHIERVNGVRRITEAVRIKGYNPEDDEYHLVPI